MELKEDPKVEQWNKFYEKELDALQWAKEFMDGYERRMDNRRRLREGKESFD